MLIKEENCISEQIEFTESVAIYSHAVCQAGESHPTGWYSLPDLMQPGQADDLSMVRDEWLFFYFC